MLTREERRAIAYIDGLGIGFVLAAAGAAATAVRVWRRLPERHADDPVDGAEVLDLAVELRTAAQAA